MRNVFYASVAAGALLMGSAAPSHATLMLQISDGTTTDTVTHIDAVTFLGGIGNFVFNDITGLSAPLVGTTTFPVLDLNSVDVTGTSGGTLTIMLTDVGDYIGGGGLATFTESTGGTLSAGSFSISSFMDCSDTAFGTTTPLTTQSFGGISFSGNQSASVSACSGTYSLTQVATLTLPGGAIYSGDSSLSMAVPEPPTLLLFGAGLLALGLGLRRKHVTAQNGAPAA